MNSDRVAPGNPVAKTYLLEMCVESLAEAKDAETLGAARVELCANLTERGTTPPDRDIQACVAELSIPTFVIVRPHGGNFVYSDAEVGSMLRDIARAKSYGVRGIAIGALRSDGSIDADVTRRLVEAARPLPVTFHRAFDETRDLFEALETLVALGVDRVLTAGGAPTALKGARLLEQLVARSNGDIIVMAGGTVRPHNVDEIVRVSGVKEVHARRWTD